MTRLATAVAILVAGLLLHGIPSDPDTPFGAAALLGSFLLFVFWALSVDAVGRVLHQIFSLGNRMRLSSRLALGSAAASLGAFVLGHLGLLGQSSAPLAITLCLGVQLLGSRRPLLPAGLLRDMRALTKAELAVAASLAYLLATALLAASFPQGHSDPLRIHLAAPRLWFEAGRITVPRSMPIVLQASYWEYLFLWGNSLLCGPRFGGLLEGQLFAQWTHVLFGFLGTGLALYEFPAFAGFERRWRLLGTLAALSILTLGTPWSGKSDWGVCLWVLTGAGLLASARRTDRRALAVSGLLFGIAFAAKFTSLFAIAGLGAAWLVARPRGARGTVLKETAVLAAAFAVAAAPILARNGALTGDPFFPALARRFPTSWLSGSYANLQAQYEADGINLDPGDWSAKARDLLETSPLLPLLAATPFLPPLRATGGAVALATLLWGLVTRQGFGESVRLAGTTLLLLSTASFLAVPLLLERIRRARPRRLLLALSFWALFAVACFRLIPTPRIWLNLDSLTSAPLIIRDELVGGEAKAWLRMNATSADTIATSGDNQLYYLSGLHVFSLPEQPDLDPITFEVHDPRQLLALLRQYNVRYWLDTRHWERFFWSRRAMRLGRLITQAPLSIVYAGRDAVVVDLQQLESELGRACFSEPEFRPPPAP